MAGDLSRVVLFALRNVERKDVKITQTRKTGLSLNKPQLLHVGAEARSVIRAWAEEEGVSFNGIMVSVLEQFFKRLRKTQALREELRLELRARRGFDAVGIRVTIYLTHQASLPRRVVLGEIQVES